jgi:hypothetical protein
VNAEGLFFREDPMPGITLPDGKVSSMQRETLICVIKIWIFLLRPAMMDTE